MTRDPKRTRSREKVTPSMIIAVWPNAGQRATARDPHAGSTGTERPSWSSSQSGQGVAAFTSCQRAADRPSRLISGLFPFAFLLLLISSDTFSISLVTWPVGLCVTLIPGTRCLWSSRAVLPVCPVLVWHGGRCLYSHYFLRLNDVTRTQRFLTSLPHVHCCVWFQTSPPMKWLH